MATSPNTFDRARPGHDVIGWFTRGLTRANYCIATGWCNRWLAATGFFPACERLVTRLTGLQPREDEKAFEGRW